MVNKKHIKNIILQKNITKVNNYMLKNIILIKSKKLTVFFRFFYLFLGKYLHSKNIRATFVVVKDGSCETSLL